MEWWFLGRVVQQLMIKEVRMSLKCLLTWSSDSGSEAGVGCCLWRRDVGQSWERKYESIFHIYFFFPGRNSLCISWKSWNVEKKAATSTKIVKTWRKVDKLESWEKYKKLKKFEMSRKWGNVEGKGKMPKITLKNNFEKRDEMWTIIQSDTSSAWAPPLQDQITCVMWFYISPVCCTQQ